MVKIYLFFVTLFTLGSCSNDDDNNENFSQNDFCTSNRELQEEFEDRRGKLIYLEEKDKYAIVTIFPKPLMG